MEICNNICRVLEKKGPPCVMWDPHGKCKRYLHGEEGIDDEFVQFSACAMARMTEFVVTGRIPAHLVRIALLRLRAAARQSARHDCRVVRQRLDAQLLLAVALRSPPSPPAPTARLQV